jgi:hypothetical protein
MQTRVVVMVQSALTTHVLFGCPQSKERAVIAREYHVPQTPFWKIARARLVSVVEIVALPLSLVEAFCRTDDGNAPIRPGPAPADRALLDRLEPTCSTLRDG